MGSTESQGGFMGGPTWGSPVSSCKVATGKNATRKNKIKTLKNIKIERARGLICKGDGARHCPHGGHIDLKMHLYKLMRSPDLPWGVQSKNFRNFSWPSSPRIALALSYKELPFEHGENRLLYKPHDHHHCEGERTFPGA